MSRWYFVAPGTASMTAMQPSWSSEVHQATVEGLNDEDGDNGEKLPGSIDGDEEEVYEWITSETDSYIGPLIAILAAVPLVIFKREKEISRMLEFEGMWISSQPAEDNLRAHWDKLVLSTPSFPQMYWDKFVKKKVRNKYSIQYDYDEITTLLGMDKTSLDTDSDGAGFSRL
ncbi:unnamed protein product [Trichobilharzia regenti]|nr:unnamed protein product [Trichobilharzia regenti]